ncbi:hypothetical protein [Nonomuraea pusilla]|uniref:Orotate phosphoribosyltransferase n=1 Tax=Nonomuraea pusilla TaxID=46177 RepID=A0A1H8EHN9_9ACTN|nr:hypothetical protein [Nonomuraea pusilla]SEN18983.1 orotate phosphoribosyltransferase [Nonomuraea pusilla]
MPPEAIHDLRAISLDVSRRRAELSADIRAAAQVGRAPGQIDGYAVQSRPAILRRLATMISEKLPRQLDRLVAPEPAGVALTTAVALETGLPTTVIRAGGGIGGAIHRGELVAVVVQVIASGDEAVRTADAVCAHGAAVAGVFAAVDLDQGGGARLATAGHTLHTVVTISGSDSPQDRGLSG